MYALSVGVQNIGRTLPHPAYALLSGLNAATVGIIAVSAVQLAEKAIRDKISRILVIFGACAGVCYNSLWYFPVLMVIGGFAIVAWDGWLSRQVLRAKLAWKNRHNPPVDTEEANMNSVAMESIHSASGAETERNDTVRSRQTAPVRPLPPLPQSSGSPLIPSQSASGTGAESQKPNYAIRVRTGFVIMAVFFGVLLRQQFLCLD